MQIYEQLVRPALFGLDPESAHHLALNAAKLLRFEPLRRLVSSSYRLEDQRLTVELFGLRFSNPIGLAAGFDKNCQALELFAALGFGHIEVGTVTGRPQPGNDRPRIFRLPADQALINRMGFPSDGADAVAARLAKARGRLPGVVIGANLGKTKAVPLDEAVEDYLYTFGRLEPLADYFVLNVSSPNTPELRKLQERDRLSALFRAVQSKNSASKPILVKIAPDLSLAEIDDVISCALECEIAGIIATNTTLGREGLSVASEEKGGLSGRPLRAKALGVVRHITAQCGDRLPVIGVGGIFGPEDLSAYLDSGAKLVQVYTGLIYRGPSMIRSLKRGLLARNDRPA